MSVAIGASATGARAYTATASQGLLFMAEAVYNAAGLGLPIVMTVANRAIGAPINIWNDHTDALSQRDCGWLQLFAEDNQEALDLHIQAFRLAEELSLPVMVCMDGFILTHAYERVDMPTQAQVDSYLPPYEPRQVLDPAEPVSIGAMVGPEAFMEVRYLAHAKQQQALDLIPAWADEFRRVFGRPSGGLVHEYRTSDADVIVVALGSVLGTIKDTVDQMREQGHRIGVLGITCFRPWPSVAVRNALQGAQRVVVLRKPGGGHGLASRAERVGVVLRCARPRAHGDRRPRRPFDHPRSTARVFEQALADSLEHARRYSLTATGPWSIGVLEVSGGQRRSGPIAEGILKAPSAASPRDRLRRTATLPTHPLLPTGTFTVGNRLLPQEQRSVQSGRSARTRSTQGTARARVAAGARRRYAIVTLPWRQRTASSSPAGTQRVAWRWVSTPDPETSCARYPGFTVGDARRSARVSQPHCQVQGNTTCASWRKVAMAARRRSASAACWAGSAQRRCA